MALRGNPGYYLAEEDGELTLSQKSSNRDHINTLVIKVGDSVSAQ